ncbi:MAG: flgL 1, partial [Firmicutes bacterium]|nr:flgL 1 [Bacillota bacterium]
TTFTLDGLLDEIDANLSAISTETSDLGARMNYVETCTSRLASDYTTYTGLLSSNIDSDISVATTEYATAQTIYDASLSVGAKVITKTLVDYLT